MTFLSGKKTYIAGGILLLWTIYAGITNMLEGAKVIELVLLSLSILGLRNGVGKIER